MSIRDLNINDGDEKMNRRILKGEILKLQNI